jgi:hypothetical protein
MVSRVAIVTSVVALSFAVVSCGRKDPVSPQDMEQAAFQDLSTEVTSIVADADRAADVLALIELFEQEYILLRQVIENQRIETRALNANYDATPEDFDALIASNQELMRAARERVTDAHLAIIAATTPEEWDELHKATTKTIEQLSRSIRRY